MILKGTDLQAAEKLGFSGRVERKRPQGLKPTFISAICGTTEVVPFQRIELFPQSGLCCNL
jgi:hypothetical protein